ncbi:MAG TPA: APC family permease [Solirubrobacteraceae bacterium]|nr:APC family permease [Solirubrobacteraceae bacterium]
MPRSGSRSANIPVAAAPVPTSPGDTGLRRAITPRLLLFFIVGDVLGGGIYALVGEVAGETGGAIWAGFALALVMAAFTAGSYAELVSKYPRAGGAGLYVHRAFRRPFLSFIVAFAVVVSGITSASALARGFGGDYLSAFVDVPVVLTALALLALVAAVNLRGIEESVKLNVGFTLVEVGGLVLIVLVAAVALGQGDAEPSRAFEFKEGSSIFAATLAGSALAFYALIGFEDSVNVAEETREPSRAYPRALFGGLAIAGVLYLLVTIGASMVVPTGDLEGSSGPMLEVIKQGPLGIPEKLFAAIGLLALSNGALINMIMASRLLYGMAEEGVMPRPFQSVLPGRRTPWFAIAFTSAIAAVLVATGDLASLADTTVALLVIVFAVVNVSVLVLRRERVEHEHFRVWSFVPVVGVGISIALLTQVEGETYVRAAILVAVGVALWIVNWLVLRRERATAPRST